MFPVFFLSEGKFGATARSSQEHVEPKFGAEHSQDTGPKWNSAGWPCGMFVKASLDFINIFYEHISFFLASGKYENI
jgi:hypothetical protein